MLSPVARIISISLAPSPTDTQRLGLTPSQLASPNSFSALPLPVTIGVSTPVMYPFSTLNLLQQIQNQVGGFVYAILKAQDHTPILCSHGGSEAHPMAHFSRPGNRLAPIPKILDRVGLGIPEKIIRLFMRKVLQCLFICV